MERERWLQLYRLLCRLDKDSFRGVFRAAAVVGVYLWAVLHDRPTRWACSATNWPAGLWRGPLPSQPTMSARLRHDPRVTALLTAVGRAAEVTGEPPTLDCVKTIDGKPLPVGGYSHDPDSRWGKALRTFQRGYKLFAVWGRGRMPLAWRIAPLNTSEQAMAQEMLPELTGGGYVLGDKLYDVNKLYDAAAAAGHQLVADRKRPGTALGHCRHSPARLRSLELLRTKFGRELYALRDRIERRFATLTNHGGGLAPLPAWVRRLARVRLWVHAKLILHALRTPPPSTTAV
jgi:hypothetical protein